MSQAFFFNASGKCRERGVAFDALCITYGHNVKIGSLEFFDDLEQAIKASLTLPDCLVVIADKCLAETLKTYWEEDSNQREIILARGNRKGHIFIKSYYFYEWYPQHPRLVNSHVEVEEGYVVPVLDCVDQGLRSLISENGVVQIAPAGHTFRHPSGNRNKIFIQARELANSEPQLQFVANAVCVLIGEYLKAAKIVFIDTMGIYHFVREAIISSGGNAHIESFHSYDQLEKVSPPSEPYVCIISASTSGGMAKKLTSQGFDSNRLLTLIDKTSAGRCGKVLIPLDSVSEEYGRALSDGNETEIEIVGEHFTSKAKPPRPVALGVPHCPPSLKKILEIFGPGGVKQLNHKPPHSTASSKLLYLDVSELDDSKDFKEWLKDELAWSVSAAVDHIVFADDPASEKIAYLAADLLKLIKGKRNSPPVISRKELDASQLAKAKGILIISAVAGDGSTLREIGRDLREFVRTEVPRHFLAAVALPQTEEAWLRLKQFLERNPSNRRYGFSNWLYLPIGYDGKDTAWKALAELAQIAQMRRIRIGSVSREVADQSYELVSEVIAKSHSSFLPKSNGDALSLTEGFVFFQGAFDDRLEEVASSAVYLAIASALQRARELKDGSNRLKPTGYESVVLAPECFLRFNDNILQACLLRACHPSELDYSASPDLSKLMKEFLTKVFIRHEYEYGAASMEFAAALATRRLKLKNDDFTELVEASIERLKTSPSPLLGFLLLAA